MKRSYVKASADGNVMDDAFIDSTARAIAILVQLLKKGGTITMRGNAYMIEAEWKPPVNSQPQMPEPFAGLPESLQPTVNT